MVTFRVTTTAETSCRRASSTVLQRQPREPQPTNAMKDNAMAETIPSLGIYTGSTADRSTLARRISVNRWTPDSPQLAGRQLTSAFRSAGDG